MWSLAAPSRSLAEIDRQRFLRGPGLIFFAGERGCEGVRALYLTAQLGLGCAFCFEVQPQLGIRLTFGLERQSKIGVRRAFLFQLPPCLGSCALETGARLPLAGRLGLQLLAKLPKLRELFLFEGGHPLARLLERPAKVAGDDSFLIERSLRGVASLGDSRVRFEFCVEDRFECCRTRFLRRDSRQVQDEPFE